VILEDVSQQRRSQQVLGGQAKGGECGIEGIIRWREGGHLGRGVIEGILQASGLDGGCQGGVVWAVVGGVDESGGDVGLDAVRAALVEVGSASAITSARIIATVRRWNNHNNVVVRGVVHHVLLGIRWHRHWCFIRRIRRHRHWCFIRRIRRHRHWCSIRRIRRHRHWHVLQETPPSAPAKGIDGGLGEHHSVDDLHDALAGVHVAIHDGGVAVGGHNGGPVVAHQAGSLQSGQADAVHKHVSGVWLSHNVILEDVSQQRRSQQVLGGQAKGGECGIEGIIRWREDGHLGGGVIEGILQASGLDGGHQGGEVRAADLSILVDGVDESGGDVGPDAVRAALVEVGSAVRLGGVVDGFVQEAPPGARGHRRGEHQGGQERSSDEVFPRHHHRS